MKNFIPNQGRLIRRILEGKTDLHKLETISRKEWSEHWYRCTEVTQGSILERETEDLIILADINDFNSKLLKEIGLRAPDFARLIEKEPIKNGKLYTIVRNDELKIEEEELQITKSRKTVVAGVDTSGDNEKETFGRLLEAITKVKKTTEGEKEIAVAATSASLIVTARKIMEHLFADTATVIKVFGYPVRRRAWNKVVAEARSDTKTEATKRTRPRRLDSVNSTASRSSWVPVRRKAETVIIKPTTREHGYSQIVKMLKEKVNLEGMGIRVKSLVETNQGHVKLKVTGNKIDQEKFLKVVAETTAQSATVQLLTREQTVFINGLDCSVEENEIREAVAQYVQTNRGDIKVRLSAQVNKQRQRHAFVTLPTEKARDLVSNRRIKIGWLNCRVEEVYTPVRCFKCNEFGHMAAACKKADKTQGRCLNCLEDGHEAKVCQNVAVCYVCTDNKGHRAQSYRCPAYRKAVEDLRNKRKPSKAAHDDE
ncbi:uncharacterized protein [Euwallacea fornicatus]|uniref:uncharacterized protein n=1 Tax=Euwallacea fornicatus TaxID=995702 RepID=UPI00338DFDD0